MMPFSKIREMLADVQAYVDDGDWEYAHQAEDELKDAFIKSLAVREDDIGLGARLVLRVKSIKYGRWYA